MQKKNSATAVPTWVHWDRFIVLFNRGAVNEQEVDIRFQAPGRAGQYNFVIYVRSDSYIEIDCKKDFTITVHERQEEPEPEWSDDDIPDDQYVTDSEAEISESSSEEESD